MTQSESFDAFQRAIRAGLVKEGDIAWWDTLADDTHAHLQFTAALSADRLDHLEGADKINYIAGVFMAGVQACCDWKRWESTNKEVQA